MSARDCHTGVLVQPEGVVGVVHTAAMAVECSNVLPLLEPAIKIGGQTECGLNPLTLQLLGDHWPHRRTKSAKTNDIEGKALALRVHPEAGAVFLPALGAKNGLAFLRVEFQRVVLHQEIFHRVDVGT